MAATAAAAAPSQVGIQIMLKVVRVVGMLLLLRVMTEVVVMGMWMRVKRVMTTSSTTWT